MVGLKHNDPVMWASLLNKKSKGEPLQGQKLLNHSSLELPLLGWLGFAATALRCVFDGIHFMGSWGLALSGWSALQPHCPVSNLEFITTSVISPQPAAWGQFLHPAQPSPAQPTQCGRDNTHVSAIPQGWDMVTVEGAQWESLLLWTNH